MNLYTRPAAKIGRGLPQSTTVPDAGTTFGTPNFETTLSICQRRGADVLFAPAQMNSLAHPDSLYLSAAQGWFELGNSVEAAAELDRITPAAREHPDVLELRWQMAVKKRDWVEALSIAEALCRLAPQSAFGWIHRSYCLHELKRTEEALNSLIPLAEKFPDDWLIRYNLACYACQLGRFPDANEWLMRAIEVGDALEINKLASEDPDLTPLFRDPNG